MADQKPPHVSRLPLPSTTTMAPPSRTVKQRRVSLPGSNPMQSISARLDRLNGSDPSNAAYTTTSGGAKQNIVSASMGPPAWGVGFRDDSGLPSSIKSSKNLNGVATPASSPTVSSPTDFTSHPGPSGSRSYSNAALPSTSNAPTDSMAGAVTRRRRAATVTARAKAREFVAPLNAAPLVTAPSLSVNTAAVSHSPTVPPPTPIESSSNGPPTSKPRKPRKRWTMEETQALVDGCNKWGVGNWKAILNDSQFEFQGRSPVDLKDRFRTYFPDAYRHHYPNAKTHLSSRVRSFLPDGTSIFEKTRSKKRRPFSAEEDEALRLGYEKHGTTWATIVKDPVFASQERRSTDLRDRFRNAFPDLYKAAGYKPRPRANTSAHARTASTSSAVLPKAPTEGKKPRRGRAGTMPASTAAQTPSSSTSSSVAERSPSARRKRTNSTVVGDRPIGPGEPTALDFYRPRGGQETPSAASTPKVAPEDIPISSDTDEGSSSDYEYEEEEQYFPLTAASMNPSKNSSVTTSPAKTEVVFAVPELPEGKREPMDEEDMDVDGDDMFHDEDEIDGTELLIHTNPDGSLIRSSASDRINSLSPTSPVVSRSIQDLLDSATAAAAALVRSNPTHSDYSDPLFNNSRPHMLPHHSSASSTSLATSTASEDWTSMSSHGVSQSGLPTSSSATWLSNPASPTPSDFYPHSNQAHGGPVPAAARIGKSAWGPQDWLSNNPRLDSNMGLFGGNGALTSWPTPASDQHAVLDRYDLYSTVEAAHDFASEADMRYNHNHPSHTHSYPDESIFRGFTHHRYAGDLIPGSGVAVHPTHLHNGAPMNFGVLGLGFGNLTGLNLGGGSINDDYAASVTSGSMSLANLNGLQDIDELSVVNHMSGAASPMKRGKEQELDLDAMIIVDTDGSAAEQHSRDAIMIGQAHGKMGMRLGLSSGIQSMEEVGAITPTGLNPASLPCPPSPLRLDQPLLGPDFQLHRRNFPIQPARPHSRSVTQSQMPAPFRPTTPSSWRDSSRSISQPPSEHRQALQRSLSYLDPITSHGGIGMQMTDDPLAYSEPASISSLDLQYGMSSGPNIFTPLTMFTDQPSIAPMRTLNSNAAASRTNQLLAQQTSQATSNNEDALDISALIHTSPIPPSRNHQRHQSQSMASPRDFNPRDSDRRKRSSWDGGIFGLLPSHTTHPADDALFLDFSRNA